MDIASINGSTGTTAASTANEATLGREDFLRMLIAQLENQDPLNPQEATEFSSQLAQFSSLEQEIAMRGALDQISAALTNGDKGTAIDLIGRDVVAETSHFERSGGETTLQYELSTASDATVLEIRDRLGALVYSEDLGPRTAGAGRFTWDGTGRSGAPVPNGIYSFEVLASADPAPVAVTPFGEGRVSGADLSSDRPVLRIGDLVVPLDRLREVRNADGVSGAAP